MGDSFPDRIFSAEPRRQRRDRGGFIHHNDTKITKEWLRAFGAPFLTSCALCVLWRIFCLHLASSASSALSLLVAVSCTIDSSTRACQREGPFYTFAASAALSAAALLDRTLGSNCENPSTISFRIGGVRRKPDIPEIMIFRRRQALRALASECRSSAQMKKPPGV